MTGHRELPITGYLDRLSARAGETIAAKVSVAAGGGEVEARLVRVLSADPNPDGPGVRFNDLGHHVACRFPGQRQPIRLGSWGEAPGPELPGDRPVCWTALVCPSVVPSTSRTILRHDGAAAQLALTIEAEGFAATMTQDGAVTCAKAAVPVKRGRWYRIWACFDPLARLLHCVVEAPPRFYDEALTVAAGASTASAAIPSAGVVTLAQDTLGGDGFDGKIEDPAILGGAPLLGDPLVTLAGLGDVLIAGWDLSRGIDTQEMAGVGRRAHDGILCNLPARGIAGARWTGEEHDWRHAPAHYGAVAFHSDDLGDVGWETDAQVALPGDLPSGSYALHLRCAAGEDWLPFFVIPPRTGERPAVAFLASTFTYQCYGNHARGNLDEAFRARIAAWGAYPHNADDYPIYGRSTYNLHPDGTGISYVTRHRPLLTMRPGYLTFVDAAGSGLRHYPADHHLLAWLEARGIAFDIVTDEDLAAEGAGLLERYAVVLTGTHPEYHDAATLDALQAHVRGGGRLCYLGGNGFYWRIGRSATLPGAIELRRADTAVRAWAMPRGEYRHSLDAQVGGLWKNARREPQQLVGVGFSTQGPYQAGWYRRTPASRARAVAWMFEGVDGDVFGNYGLIAGGAAGFELDRVDADLGSPPDTIVVAQSEGLPPGFCPAMEDVSFGTVALGGRDATPLIRADMSIFATANGGAVFSASSITFCGSLWRDGAFRGDVSHLLENVVRRFSDRAVPPLDAGETV